MSEPRKDKAREHRIEMEIVVDAYHAEEAALGWYYYLEGQMKFPFRARCIKERRISPLKVNEEVEVLNMAPEEDCSHEMFVQIRFLNRTFGVPLAQLEAIAVDDETDEAIKDWHYWMGQGYRL